MPTFLHTVEYKGTDGNMYTLNPVIVDDEVDASSENPVQNKVIKSYIDNSVDDAMENAVTDVTYDAATKKLKKQKNGISIDVVELAEVAISGDYGDLINTPTIPTVDKTIRELTTQYIRLYDLDPGIYRWNYNGQKYLYYKGTGNDAQSIGAVNNTNNFIVFVYNGHNNVFSSTGAVKACYIFAAGDSNTASIANPEIYVAQSGETMGSVGHIPMTNDGRVYVGISAPSGYNYTSGDVWINKTNGKVYTFNSPVWTEEFSLGDYSAITDVQMNGTSIVSNGVANVAVDSAMSATSTNPVQNMVIKTYVDGLIGDINTALTTLNTGTGV